jgi:hypothetical protein
MSRNGTPPSPVILFQYIEDRKTSHGLNSQDVVVMIKKMLCLTTKSRALILNK